MKKNVKLMSAVKTILLIIIYWIRTTAHYRSADWCYQTTL